MSVPTLQQLASGEWQLSCAIGGHHVFFRAEMPLYAGPEPFLSAFLLPTMAMRRYLTSPVPVCETWLRNSRALRARAADWWGFSSGGILAPEVQAPPHADVGTEAHTGLFFSGGVDAFHSLSACRPRIDKLIFIEGADTTLSDTTRREQDRRLLQSAAAAAGLDLVIIATNLREHPLFRRIGWWEAHGGALAATAHALSMSLGAAIISGSVSMQPHGSHPDLIPTYSSRRLRLDVYAGGVPRWEKLRTILADPIALQHLRVCWVHQTDGDNAMNCGVCEKCLRTLLQLECLESGVTHGLPTFPADRLDERLRRLKWIPPHVAPLWRHIAGQTSLPPSLRRQVCQLLKRSERIRRSPLRMPPFLMDRYRHLRAAWSLHRHPGSAG
ncbi:hypothetical protein [uncultured Thiohalocapsa sp.]|uniref:hypothetical protein n=1 Tax=uncultured Thiohalocapsa sp. TaxID=768990 RepID=UPI0025E2FE14|nr:hypothetical protein [uncultured Thiohalocapsa sp.]